MVGGKRGRGGGKKGRKVPPCRVLEGEGVKVPQSPPPQKKKKRKKAKFGGLGKRKKKGQAGFQESNAFLKKGGGGRGKKGIESWMGPRTRHPII